MLTAIGSFARRWASSVNPWTNTYGLARTLLALASAVTLAVNPARVLFAPSSAADPIAPVCSGIRGVSTYCLAPSHLDLVRLLSVLGLLVVASGWRPRVTGLLHWWIAFSLPASGTLLDGGDHITEVLAFLLLPVALTDTRRWHWSAPEERPITGSWAEAQRILARVSFAVIRLQVCGVYFHAAAAKFASDTWADGTSMYYWLTNGDFGAPGWLAPIVHPIVVNAVTVTLLTWGVVILEFSLAAGLVMEKRRWHRLLWLGIGLHAGIILVHGLVSFGTAMIAALILYLRPVETPFDFHRLAALARRLRPGAGKAHHELAAA